METKMLRRYSQLLGILVFLLLQHLDVGASLFLNSPDSPLSGRCTIKNHLENEYMYAAADDLKVNGRRQVFTWIPGDGPSNGAYWEKKGYWRFQQVDSDESSLYRIKNEQYSEYLGSSEAYDSERTSVQTSEDDSSSSSVSGPQTPCNNNCWTIKPLRKKGNSYLIQHSQLEGYLYAAPSKYNRDDERRRVFIGKPPSSPGKPIKNGRWIINCTAAAASAHY